MMYISRIQSKECIVYANYFQLKDNKIILGICIDGSKCKYYIGMQFNEFIDKLNKHGYLEGFINDIKNLPNIRISLLELAETSNNNKKRSGIYGIV